MAVAEMEMPKTLGEPGKEKVEALSITDRRTGRVYEVPISNDTIRAIDLRQIKVNPEDFGLMSYDPAFMNTANCKSRITFIDGEKGILRYRGYPIEQLAENCTYLEVAYLLLYGELPNRKQYQEWERNITFHTMIHESLKKFMDGFNYDAHPMGMLIAKMPTLAAFAYRHSLGMPYVYPDNSLSYAENFLHMLFKMPSETYKPNPAISRALDVLFILHADHEQNCGTHAMRGIGSSHPDPYSAVAGAAAALYGPLHGGANEEVLKMLAEIGSKDRVPGFIKEVKEGKGEKRLMGFGHRVYKNYDPRARIIKKIADDVFEVTGRNPLLDIALELERIALQDDYFVKRKLYPNVDFYSGLIYQAIGMPTAAFTVLFAIPRTSGWISQWGEMLADPEQKIARPRQVYIGPEERQFVPIEKR